ncbi:RHS repeat-associated core domain-containing protein [Pseudomonas sp. SDO5532_S415]
MAATSSVHSNALSFMSSARGGVDPRTGLYKFSINFFDIQTNDLRGPGFRTGLNYSPLNTLDTGYGRGWNVSLSQYTPGNNVLALSTGETFKVTGTSGNQLVMKEKKLDSFHFFRIDDEHFRVDHKSGVVEFLKVHGSGVNRIALPEKIYAPEGHSITLEHTHFRDSHYILKSIKDDSDRTLLAVKRDNSSVDIRLYPFDGPDGDPVARFVMTLQGSDKYVSKITLPTENGASWRFGYWVSPIDHQLYIRTVETPAGGREEILYQDLGHQFPQGSGRTPLPRVTHHRTYPDDQPDTKIDVRYSYSKDEHNFVGRGLNIAWDDGGLDNLYKHIGAYKYLSVETLYVDDEPVRSIERVFNQFHLQTRETTTQNDHVQTVETTYALTPNVPFEQQTPYCQLPLEVKTTWAQVENGTVMRQRSETVSSTYDPHGNLLTETQANGVTEISTWYPAADADDFVRHLKDRTVTPAPSPNGKAPTLCTRYTYKSLEPLTGSPLPKWKTVESETLVQLEASGETELQRTEYEYIEDPDDAFQHGRVSQQKLTMNGTSSFIDFQYCRLDSPQLGVPVLETKQTARSDFDCTTKTTTVRHSLVTGQELLNQDGDVKIQYAYNAMNQLTSEIVAYDTPNEARREYLNTLSTVHGEPAEHIIINARQVKTRTVHDGLGRAILVERDNVDSDDPSLYRRTSSARYNARGELIESTEYDWLNGKEQALITRFEYDDWSQQCTATGPDHVQSHQRIDPIGTADWKGPVIRSWLQSAGPNPIISARNETWLNAFGKPVRTRVLDATEQEVSFETYQYDGLGRCTQTSDAYKRITKFDYDPWSRVIKTTLPNNDIVEQDFAVHSAAELPVALRVIGNGKTHTAGEQDFDGLGRLTRLTSGVCTERYFYDGGQMQVRSKTTSAGDPVVYDYNLRLTDQPISTRARDETAGFDYDPTSARLTCAHNEQGTREYAYNKVNQLLSERWIDKQGKAWNTQYSSSLQGRLLKRTDLKSADSDGLDTVHHYDDFGRVERIDQGQLTATFEYDPLGQLCKTTTKDLAADSVLVTELEYDDQGHEVRRTQKLNTQPERIQEQTWLLDGQLESRHLRQGAVSLLKETFGYDVRGRLTNHRCSGMTLPRNSEGRPISEQIFTFDAVDNIILVRTKFADGSTDERMGFQYASNDPFLLEKVTYTPSRATGDPTFSHNANGDLLNDERGQRLYYDSQSRLLKVETPSGPIVNQYGYDSNDQLVTSQEGHLETLRFYQDLQLSAVVKDKQQTHFLYNESQPLGQQQAGDTSKTLLLQSNANDTVVAESQQDTLRTSVYSAYGERHSDDTPQSRLAFNGEFLDPDNGWYLLGKGYRAYNPVLMRFHTRDSLSPFGSGGVNPYGYCRGNPIALRDPTGHEAIGWSGRLRHPDEDYTPPSSGGGGGWLAWTFVAVGAVFALYTGFAAVKAFKAAAGAGPLAPILFAKAGALATAAVMSGGATAAQAVSTANGDEEAGKWAMYLGLASIIPSVGAGALDSFMTRVASSAMKEVGEDLPRLLSSVQNSSGGATNAAVTGSGLSSNVAGARTQTIQTINRQSVRPLTPPRPARVAPNSSVTQSSAASKTPQASQPKPPAPKPTNAPNKIMFTGARVSKSEIDVAHAGMSITKTDDSGTFKIIGNSNTSIRK